MNSPNKTIKIVKLNSATMFIDGPPNILNELVQYFRVKSPNCHFHPLYKAKMWDGFINVFNKSTQHMPIGLLKEVENFCKKVGYIIDKDFSIGFDMNPDKFAEWVKSLNISFRDEKGQIIPGASPREYQMGSTWDSITKQHWGIEIPTSGGKTLISYIIARFMQAANKKMLVVVPTTTLVEQTYSDWFDFGWDRVRDCCHRIHGDHEKYFGADVTISTWQSLYRNQSVFEIFDCLLIDEAHGVQSKSLSNIAKWCCNAEWRIGMSGTFPDINVPDEKLAYFSCTGALGPVRTYTSYKEMQEKGWIPLVNIMVIRLRYPLIIRQNMCKVIGDAKEEYKAAKEQGISAPSPYNIELDLIHNFDMRNKFISDLIEKSCNGNTMILFTKKEKHGWPLRDYLIKYFGNEKKVIYIDGDVDTKQRDLIRHHVDRNENIILLASYGTFSTGISIKNIHNLVFASGYKAKVKVLQSIGRALRKMKSKDSVKIWDLVDDCGIKMKDRPGYMNYSMKHFEERKQIYEKKGLNWKSITYKF